MQFLLILSIFFNIISNTTSFILKAYLNRQYVFQIRSFIDQNKDLEGDTNINSGLGNERILYADEDVIFVHKPENSQTAPGFLESNSLATHIQQLFHIPRVDHMIVHRLDYATSGVLVFARHLEALKVLNEQIRNRHAKSFYKRYTAVVNGHFDEMYGEIDLPIGRDNVLGPPLQKINYDGKLSLTDYRVISQSNSYSLVQLYPRTGRTHQLRVHLSAINHPILGDFFYSPPDVYKSSPRLLLHAEELRLRHPRTRQDMRVISPCPFQLTAAGIEFDDRS